MGTQKKVTHVGLDCHKNFSRVTARDEHGKVAFRQRLEHADRQELRKQLRAWPAGLPVVLEGTFGWGWLSDEIQAAGHQPHLASSRKTAAWRQARGMAKSNRIDADLLSELWPEKERWWEVWLAPPEVRDQREWLRYRMTLVRTQTAIKNRIHATLHRHGVLHPHSDLFGVAGWKFLKALSSPDDATLRDSARATLAGYLKLLGHVRRQIAEATRELARQLRKSEEGELWRSLPGVSWVLAYTILAEVGWVRRFQDGRRLCSYALLVPIAHDSGDEHDAAPLGRHVGHLGRRVLKWALIEAARGAVRKSAFFRAIWDRRTDGGKRDRCRGYIAVARELCRVGHSCVKGRRRYREERPAKAGQAATQETPAGEPAMDLLVRECVGPDCPMAAAAG
jgi:transposase